MANTWISPAPTTLGPGGRFATSSCPNSPRSSPRPRSGLALVWKIVLVVELLGRGNGVGFQLHLFFQLFDVPSILAYTIAFVAVVQLIEVGVFNPLERHANRWRG
jgi:hypothetical protein